MTAQTMQAAHSTTGVFNYLTPATTPSLYRNGKVLTRRDVDGSDDQWEGVNLDGVSLTVSDARLFSGAQTKRLAAHGFELKQRPLDDPALDFHDHQQVARHYYPQCEDAVREGTGAAHVFAFDHNLRSALGKKSRERIAGGQQVQGPALVVHGDYTLTSASQRLHDLTRPPGANDTLRSVLGEGEALISTELADRALEQGQRFSIINVWRSIAPEPVAINPLGLCDARTVAPEDLVVFEIHYAERVGENYFARHDARHRWYYYSAMRREEILLIKQWDSTGALARSSGTAGDGASPPDAPCTFSFHSAFKDPATPPDAPDRRSIEVRCMVIHD